MHEMPLTLYVCCCMYVVCMDECMSCMWLLLIMSLSADVVIEFDEVSYSVSESDGVATVRLRKEGVNERDVAVLVTIDGDNTIATGMQIHLSSPDLM